ncbi:uncharacterized protein ACLA_098300 [Aspergillus clavatus NRRL 1]|uniref:Uncharacterized protein n=1 Tax=Aspergillus clavatus (strain ATCC 1007 / CBS 513.65 / DSM 816 / NCTC 3887 / NRRL 1 / QM 1276 / 107) TaxID=344612 RepID=A1CMV1_ASPCL|nr:uncharacterized protein ACLA_098300 [Aspergillus clavatus NRRL 1]EAW08888.1 hypothetical protein ACLA_098300 [Aspergillus clavatus NRRL 1]
MPHDVAMYEARPSPAGVAYDERGFKPAGMELSVSAVLSDAWNKFSVFFQDLPGPSGVISLKAKQHLKQAACLGFDEDM